MSEPFLIPTKNNKYHTVGTIPTTKNNKYHTVGTIPSSYQKQLIPHCRNNS